MWVELLFILLLILCNGLLAMAEIAIVSARKVRLSQMAKNGRSGAEKAIQLAEQPAYFLSTIQIGITLVGILTGVFGGATIAKKLEILLANVPGLGAYSETLSVLLVVVIITYFSLVLGELAPKQIGLHRPEAIASALAPLMDRLARLTAPLVRLLSASSALLLRLLGIHPSREPEMTEEDIRDLLEQGAEEGVLVPVEEDMIQRVFRLGDRTARELMTPRRAVVTLDIEDPLEEILHKLSTSGFSRFPVIQGDVDNTLGLVRAKDLLNQLMQGKELDLHAALQQAFFVPESSASMPILEQFKQKRIHMAFVVDEYGGFQGIVTPTDILEAIVGEIPDLDDRTDPDILQRPDGSWLVNGTTDIEQMKEALQLPDLPGEGQKDYQTLAGFILATLSRIPITGDSFEWSGLHFEVVDMDGHRVDKVLVKRL
jgi:putative hemolysin